MSWMMIAYYSMCPSNEWLPSEQLSVKTDWGMPEGEGGGGWGVTLCARSEFWFSFFFFFDSGVSVLMQLNYAESRLTQLEGCHCERTCSANGLVYRDKELWVEPENCRNCACKVSVTFVLKNHRMTDFSITILKKKKKNVGQIECFNPFFYPWSITFYIQVKKNTTARGFFEFIFNDQFYVKKSVGKMFVNIKRENNWSVHHFQNTVCETVDSTL